MKETLTAADVIEALARNARDLTAAAEQLRELDAAIGDGDLGITMTIGFQAVTEVLPGLAGSDIGTVLMRSGMAFNRKAASTFGALYATMMMRAAKEARGLSEITLADAARMFTAAVEGVRERGKADVGDKTMLDALAPASEALQAAAKEGAPLAEGLQRAAQAAEEGMRQTTALKSKIGRASWFSERTQGIQDPGATAIYLMLRSLCGYVNEA
ncbi:MAG: dihydroxyacetone kinase subunit L [Chloroflexi bacterium]|nr:dihydroxyacetone kinase subunit L [Chloroflexota bacterium]